MVKSITLMGLGLRTYQVGLEGRGSSKITCKSLFIFGLCYTNKGQSQNNKITIVAAGGRRLHRPNHVKDLPDYGSGHKHNQSRTVTHTP